MGQVARARPHLLTRARCCCLLVAAAPLPCAPRSRHLRTQPSFQSCSQRHHLAPSTPDWGPVTPSAGTRRTRSRWGRTTGAVARSTLPPHHCYLRPCLPRCTPQPTSDGGAAGLHPGPCGPRAQPAAFLKLVMAAADTGNPGPSAGF
ncbi:MAG: hypothetical protein J3K34DRAFT_399640 [Monoraphidium minutum]|nr:MAG: hypothetical protein J3K34DRAFT_399640 [Monoraphidium minutum]